MAPLLAVFLVLAATAEPLSKEMEYRLSLARALPAPYSAAVIVALMPSAKLSRGQATALAEEAYQLAGDDQATAVLAWTAYRDNYDPKTNPLLDFPQRERTRPASCEQTEVNDPRNYYRNARAAGDAEFQLALRNIRSAVEVGRAIEVLAGLPPVEQNALVPRLTRLLSTASGSDREFLYAIRFTRLHSTILEVAEDRQVTSGRMLLASYRNFLTTNLSGMRCANNRAEEFKGILEEFNRTADKIGGVPMLPYEAARVITVDPGTKADRITSFPLTYKVAQAPIDDVSVTGMLHEIEQFQPEETPATGPILTAKVSIYQKFAARLKGNRFEDRVVREWVHFVAYSQLQEENPKLWFACARSFADWAKNDTAKLSELASAGDPALAAYVRLVTLLPESEVTRVLP